MEQESENKMKVVQPVEEQKPENESKPAFDLSQIEKKVPKAFRGYIKPVVAWAESVEARITLLAESMPDKQKVKEAMSEWLQEQRQKQIELAQKMQPTQQPGGNAGALNVGQLAQLIPYFLGTGGSDQLNQLAMKALQSQISMSTSITNAIVAKIASKATTDVAEEIVK